MRHHLFLLFNIFIQPIMLYNINLYKNLDYNIIHKIK